ncbi:hypothetical protein A2U01_0049154, partial [Trifolium medium]|nr:hypothetical protein [Trifolium medium]
ALTHPQMNYGKDHAGPKPAPPPSPPPPLAEPHTCLHPPEPASPLAHLPPTAKPLKAKGHID